MRVQTLYLEGRLPDLNNVLKAAKAHWSDYAKMKREATDRVAWTCKAQRLKPMDKVILRVTWYEIKHGKPRDQSNVFHGIKYIEDGLVVAGIIPDDDPGHVQQQSHRCVYGDIQAVSVEIQEVMGVGVHELCR